MGEKCRPKGGSITYAHTQCKHHQTLMLIIGPVAGISIPNKGIINCFNPAPLHVHQLLSNERQRQQQRTSCLSEPSGFGGRTQDNQYPPKPVNPRPPSPSKNLARYPHHPHPPPTPTSSTPPSPGDLPPQSPWEQAPVQKSQAPTTPTPQHPDNPNSPPPLSPSLWPPLTGC